MRPPIGPLVLIGALVGVLLTAALHCGGTVEQPELVDQVEQQQLELDGCVCEITHHDPACQAGEYLLECLVTTDGAECVSVKTPPYCEDGQNTFCCKAVI